MFPKFSALDRIPLMSVTQSLLTNHKRLVAHYLTTYIKLLNPCCGLQVSMEVHGRTSHQSRAQQIHELTSLAKLNI